MLEILTKFGAVIHIDPQDDNQKLMLDVATSAFGGAITIQEIGDKK